MKKSEKKTDRIIKEEPAMGTIPEREYDPGVNYQKVVAETFKDLLEPKRVESTVKELQAIMQSSGDIIKLFGSFVSKGLMLANEVSNVLEGKQGRALLPDDDVIAVRRIAGKLQK